MKITRIELIVPGPNGGTSNYTFCYVKVNINIPPTNNVRFKSATATQLQSIVLPDGHSWNFQYNDPGDGSTYNNAPVNYGTLTQITLPTGGTISYAYATTGSGGIGCQNAGRFVTSRTENANDGTGAHTWTYSYSTTQTGVTASPFAIATTVTDPLGNQTVHTFTSLYAQDSCPSYETQTQSYQGSSSGGMLLKTVNTTYNFTPTGFTMRPVNVVPATVTTVLSNGKTSTVTKTYDSGASYANFGYDAGTGIYGKVISESASDLGTNAAGPTLKIVNTNYLALSNSNYLAANLLDLASSQQVTDGGGNQVAYTTFGYDETTPQPSNISTQLGSAPNSVRGNQTSVNKWLNTSGTYLTSTNKWYDSGEVYQSTDPMGNTTTHTYSSDFAGAYPTQTCDPLKHCVNGYYDFNTGLMTSFTDANGNQTTFGYDSMRRVTSVVSPADPSGNKPEITFNYSAAGTFPVTVQRQKTITPSLTDSITTTVDGLGRVIEAQHATPSGNATVVTTYDANGRKASVTNPYFSTSDPTYGVTSFQYDGLGRLIQTTKPDGSITAEAYEQSPAATSNTDCTLITDEAGNPRQTCIDGLGRLLEVDEPPANSGNPGTAASGSGTVTGNEQSAQVVVTPAIPGSGAVTVGGGPVQWQTIASATTGGTTSITINGSEQQNPKGVTPGSATVTIGSSTNGEQVIPATTASGGASVSGTLQSTQVVSQSATSATITVSVGGQDGTNTISVKSCGGIYAGRCTSWVTNTSHPRDTGYMQYSVNANGAVITSSQVSYNGNSTTSSLAQSLAGALPSNSYVTVTWNGSNGFTITASSAGTGGNSYSVSIGAYSSCTSGTSTSGSGISQVTTTTTCGSQGWSFSTNTGSGTFSGGGNTQYQTVYDSGTASITLNGVSYPSPAYSWSGSSTTAASIASGLASALGSSSLVTASVSGGTVTITARNPGQVGNYSLSASITYDSSHFSHSSFSISNSGSTLTGGKDPVYDSGTVTITVGNTGATHSDSANWGQGDTTTTIASNLAKAINSDTGAPVIASASGATVTLTSIVKGSIGNYPLSVAVNDTATGFSTPSFAGTTSGPTLTGGWPNPNAVDSGTMAVAVGSKTYTVNWGKSDFPGSIASNLVTAITGDPSVTPTLSGNTIYLNPNQPGTTSYSFSTTYTYDSGDFTQSSFSPTNSIADYGTSTITVGGHADSTWWSAGANPTSITTALANQINGDSAALVNATTINGSSAPCGTPPPASAGNSLVSFADTNGGLHWAYFDIGHHVCSLSWTSGSGYAYVDITALSGAPAAAAGSGLAAFGDFSGGLHWAYLDSNGHVQNLAWNSGNNYSVTDVTAAATATAARPGSPVAAFADPGGGEHWSYLDSNQHVDSISWSSSGGYSTGVDLTATTSAPIAATGSPLAAFADAAGGWHWAYFASGQHAYSLNWTAGGGYTNGGDITAASGAPAAGSSSVLAAFGDASGGEHWTYFRANQHVYNIYWNPCSGCGYGNGDVTASATNTTVGGNAPAAMTGSGLAGFADSDGAQYWAYLAGNGHAYNLSWTASGGYTFSDLTTGSGAPAAAGTLVTGFSVHGGGQEQWAYLGANNNVYQIAGTSGPYTLFSMTGSTSAGVNLTARSAGANTDYGLASSTAYDSQQFAAASFNSTTSASALTGGANTVYTTVYDAGTVSLTVGGFTVTAPYQQGTTASSMATMMAQSLNNPSSSVTASTSGPAVLITATAPGTQGDYSLSWTANTSKPSLFSQPSFGVTLSGAALAGGANPSPPGLTSSPTVTLYSYDVLGNLLCSEQHGGVNGTGCSSAPSNDASSPWRVRRFTYDSLARLLTATNPESGTISYSYDANGNMLEKTSPAPNQNGSATQTISYCYDPLKSVTGKAYSAQTCTNGLLPSGTAVVSYFYDAGTNGIGHLTSLTDQAGPASYIYDALGRISSEQRTIAGIQKSLSYTYNLDNSVATVTYPSGAVVTYTSDSAGRILSAVDQGNSINYVTNATYQAAGQPTGYLNGNSGGFAGITNTFGYNNRLQPDSISAASPTQSILNLQYNFHLGAGDNGNVWAIVNNRDTTRNQTFSYDALNRLITAQNAGTDCSQTTLNGATRFWGNSYGYDPWGNLISKTPTKCSAENLSVTANGQNQIHTGSSPDYTYDAAGNTTHDATTGNNYTYDAENRITGADGFTYTYNAEGDRVEKSNGSTGTIYWYMTPGVVGESDLTGAMKSEYIFFVGGRVARKDLASKAVSYYFSDRLHSASVITDSNGNILSESDFYPWGGELQFANSDPNHYKFTGKERDGETGLDYFGARYYGSWTGRFLTPDWADKAATIPYAELADPQSLDLYSYVRNRPTVLVDIDGHEDSNNAPQVQTVSQTVTANGVTYTLNLTATTTTTFNQDGSADVTTKITGTITTTDPNTGKPSTTPIDPITVTHSIDRSNDGRITVDGKVAPRTWGDNIRDVANTVSTWVDPVGSLIHNGGDAVGKAVDAARSKQGQSFIAALIQRRYNYDKMQMDMAAKARAATGNWFKMVGQEWWNVLKSDVHDVFWH